MKLNFGVVRFAFSVAVLPASVNAAPLPADSAILRHEVQLLADLDVIDAPVVGWPLSAADLAGGSADSAIIKQAVGADSRLYFSIGGLSRDFTLRGFDSGARENGEATAGLQGSRGRFDARLRLARVSSPADGKSWRFDGSQAGVRLGNWWLGASAVDRWWGPGWESALGLSSNARPVPALTVQRRRSTPFVAPVLRWLGPWTTQVLWGQLEKQRDVADARLFAWRFGFRPWRRLEVGITRTAQWCGAGRPCGASTFVDLLSGIRDNQGQNVSAEEEPGNQLAGFDLRYRFNALSRSWAAYIQSMGEDEHQGRPSAYLGLVGLSTWGSGLRGGSYRIYAEYANTACSGLTSPDSNLGCAYQHSIYTDGYRYRGRAIGHSLDGDGNAIALGALWRTPRGHLWRGAARIGELNRGNFRNSAAAARTEIADMDLSYAVTTGIGDFSVGVGVERRRLENSDATWYGRGRISWTARFD